MKKITLEITVQEGELIISSLAKLPFEKVYKLIEKLNYQAQKSFLENSEN